MSRQKSSTKPATVIIIVVSLFLVMGMAKNAMSLYSARNRLETKEADVKVLEADRRAIKAQVEAQTDAAALDQAIHNKLNLTKPDETVVVITGDESFLNQSEAAFEETQPTNPRDQWWQLFNQKDKEK